MSQDRETDRKNSKEAEAYLIRHCTAPDGVILVEAEDNRGVFTTFEKAIAFARAQRGQQVEFSLHFLDDPEFTNRSSRNMH